MYTTKTSFFAGLKLFPEEHIIELQREHWIVLAGPLLMNSFAVFVLVVSAVFLYFNRFVDLPIPAPALFFSILAAISFFLTLSIYLYIRWFFQFYVITNKRMAHVHFFRFGGFHLDEVFYTHDRGKPSEIDRNAPNMFYDFFDIEDVYVYFQRSIRPEPFVFKTPQNADKIEELLENHLLNVVS